MAAENRHKLRPGLVEKLEPARQFILTRNFLFQELLLVCQPLHTLTALEPGGGNAIGFQRVSYEMT